MKRTNYTQSDFMNSFIKASAFGLLGYAVVKIFAEGNEKRNERTDLFLINELYKKEGGNPLASNALGSGQFNYERFLQLEVDEYADDKRSVYGKQAGIECKMSTAVFFFKSLGLIPPDMSRFEFEDEFTHILDKSKSVPTKNKNLHYTIPAKFNAAMRGYSNSSIKKAKGIIAGETNQVSFFDSTIAEIANELRKTKYAKDRKMDSEKLVRLDFQTKKELISGLNLGLISFVSLHNKKNEAKHYSLAVSGICLKDLCKITLFDDSYQSIRWDSEKEMLSNYYNSLETVGLKNFWTLVPESRLSYYNLLIKK